MGRGHHVLRQRSAAGAATRAAGDVGVERWLAAAARVVAVARRRHCLGRRDVGLHRTGADPWCAPAGGDDRRAARVDLAPGHRDRRPAGGRLAMALGAAARPHHRLGPVHQALRAGGDGGGCRRAGARGVARVTAGWRARIRATHGATPAGRDGGGIAAVGGLRLPLPCRRRRWRRVQSPARRQDRGCVDAGPARSAGDRGSP